MYISRTSGRVLRVLRWDFLHWQRRNQRYPTAYRGGDIELRVARWHYVRLSVCRESARWTWGLTRYYRHCVHLHAGPVGLSFINGRITGDNRWK